MWLVVREGPRAGAVLKLGPEPALIGRDPDADLVLDAYGDRVVSARHARVEASEEGWLVLDLGSRNGTWVDGERIRGRRSLRPGDVFRLGRTGPSVVFTDLDPSTRVGAKALGLPATVATAPSVRSPRSRAALISAGALAVAALGGLAVFALSDGPAGTGPEPSAPALDGSSSSGSVSTSPEGVGAGAPDTVALRLARELEELRERVSGMARELAAARGEADAVRGRLESAEDRGASREEVDSLRRRLQTSEAELDRLRMAPSLDYETILAASRAATAQVWVEFEEERIAATAFGVDGLGGLVTNRHVVEREGAGSVVRVGVQYPGRTGVVPATVEKTSPDFDLALIRLADPGGGRPAIRDFNRRADTLAIGSPVLLVGYPLGGDPRGRPLSTTGLVVAAGEGHFEIEGYGNPGLSGSPVFDGTGEVIGVVIGGRAGENRLVAVSAVEILAFLRSP